MEIDYMERFYGGFRVYLTEGYMFIMSDLGIPLKSSDEMIKTDLVQSILKSHLESVRWK